VFNGSLDGGRDVPYLLLIVAAYFLRIHITSVT
jgi:hypothetical protein